MSIPAKRAGRKSPAVSISKKVYTMATVDGSDAEITMYGDIYEEQPTNWWGEPVEGQYILLSEFWRTSSRSPAARPSLSA